MMNSILRNLTTAVSLSVITLAAACCDNSAYAQPEELDQFQKDVDRLFKEIARESEKNGKPNPFGDDIREMNPGQFHEFQEKFFERFFGEDDAVKRFGGASKSPGTFVRNRPIGHYEKQSESHLEAFREIVEQTRQSIVSIQIEDKAVAFGTMVDNSGNLVTKASELLNADKVDCVFADGTKHEASLVGVNKDYDLALLHIPKVKTVPVKWDEHFRIGKTVVTSDQTGKPLATGVVSVMPRSLVGTNLAFLGVGPGPHQNGVEVLTVEPQTSAARAGLQVGDIIVSLAKVSTSSVDSLVNAIRSQRPGDKVTIKYLRGGTETTAEAILDSASMPGDREMRIRLMNRMGAIPSKRSAEFPSVLQHDSPLLPEQCGSPLLNLDGRAIGLNIARGGRTESFAIPANRLQEIVQQLKASQN